jgi:prolyl-tRNA synthetase
LAQNEAPKTAITPTRQEDYRAWYRQIVRAADLAQSSPVRGCVVIKPWAYAIWENMRRELDAMIKATGHKNAYLPLFIPRSLLEREAEHVEGFARECAVVTHHRLSAGPAGGLVPDPEARLAEPLIVRPTSEALAGAAFAGWVKSYRDLPLLINQWSNVVRWERRTRPFLRSVEFLWQEGHTAHETADEAREEASRMLDVYSTFAEGFLAMPVVRGLKTRWDRFPGAVETYSIEAMMQDRRALQAGTSHFLGQRFSRASAIEFEARDGTRAVAWTTSWGVSTRLLGALIMVHGDDDGLVLPPRLAPAHAVILPVIRGEDSRGRVLEAIESLAKELRSLSFAGRSVEIEIDRRDARGGGRRWAWRKKGAPIVLEIGPREASAGTVTVARRDRPASERAILPRAELVASLPAILGAMQAGLLQRARAYRDDHTRVLDGRAELDAFFAPGDRGGPAIRGGFALSPWCGDHACDKALQRALAVAIRCTPLPGNHAPWEDRAREPGRCVVCGSASAGRVILARAY